MIELKICDGGGLGQWTAEAIMGENGHFDQRKSSTRYPTTSNNLF